jgi:hypothetical protein
MDAITMPSTTSILPKLKNNYPQFTFQKGTDFCWSSSEKTIYYPTKSDDQDVFLLHELAHALLGHSSYEKDIQLVVMERQAWDYAVKLASNYDIQIPEDIIQDTIDSYRDWMHARSTCPNCQATGMQTKTNDYTCTACNHNWRPNEARNCSLRRYKSKNA